MVIISLRLAAQIYDIYVKCQENAKVTGDSMHIALFLPLMILIDGRSHYTWGIPMYSKIPHDILK